MDSNQLKYTGLLVCLALAYPETLVAEDYYRRGTEINRTLAAGQARALVPAVQGRNHAVTPPAR